MLMNVLASGVLFLFIGPFEHVSSAETKETDVSVLQVQALQDVYIAVNDTLELNCSFNGTVHNIHVTHLAWKHNNVRIPDFTHIINNNTIQLRKNHTHYEDAGVYTCGVFNYSPKFQNITSQNITVVVGEKPTAISKEMFNVSVYGKPVQELTIQWHALQVNVTYELFVGRFPVGEFSCNFIDAAQCKLIAWNQYQILSCYVGNDVLAGQLFQVNELLDKCNGSSYSRCDIFCAKVIVKNAFGVSESETVHWNLFDRARCPPLRNLSVSVGEHNMTVSWQRPLLVWEMFELNYHVTGVVTSLLTGKPLPPPPPTEASVNYVSFEDSIKPFARYNFTASCCLTAFEEKGPPSYTEVTTKQAAPAEAPPYCKVSSRSTNSAFVTWKVPPIDTWNGKPRNFLVHYGEHKEVVNTSLDDLRRALSNSSATPKTVLKNLDPHSNYTVRVAMSTEGGYGEFSKPCFIQAIPEEDSNAKVVAGPDKTGPAGVETWTVIALGVIIGIFLVVVIAYLVKQRRSRKPVRRTIDEALGPLSGAHLYENEPDDRSSFCEDDYDIITFPLMKDVGSTVGNIPVTRI